MSDPLVTVSLRAEAFLAQLAGAPERLREAVERTIRRLAIKLQAKVKAEKLTGQVLHVRTGTLRRSINQQVFVEGDAVFAIVGTNVRYAAAHEYGFNGVVEVRGHVRKVASRSVYRGSRQTLQGVSFVSAHQRNVNLPARSFLRSALREMAPEIRRDLRAAAVGAVR